MMISATLVVLIIKTMATYTSRNDTNGSVVDDNVIINPIISIGTM